MVQHIRCMHTIQCNVCERYILNKQKNCITFLDFVTQSVCSVYVCDGVHCPVSTMLYKVTRNVE